MELLVALVVDIAGGAVASGQSSVAWCSAYSFVLALPATLTLSFSSRVVAGGRC